jgi:hypothetical protein
MWLGICRESVRSCENGFSSIFKDAQQVQHIRSANVYGGYTELTGGVALLPLIRPCEIAQLKSALGSVSLVQRSGHLIGAER